MPQQAKTPKVPKGKADMWIEGVEPPPVSAPKYREPRTYKPKILTDGQKKLRTLQKA